MRTKGFQIVKCMRALWQVSCIPLHFPWSEFGCFEKGKRKMKAERALLQIRIQHNNSFYFVYLFLIMVILGVIRCKGVIGIKIGAILQYNCL